MDIPSTHPALLPHSSFHQLEHPAVLPSLDHRSNHLPFAQDKHFLTAEPTYSLYYSTPSFPREITETFQQYLPALDSNSHNHKPDDRKCLGCVNHEECEMFKPVPLREPPAIGGDAQRPSKRMRLDNQGRENEKSSQSSGEPSSSLRHSADVNVPKVDGFRSQPLTSSPSQTPKGFDNNRVPECTIKQEIPVKDNKDSEQTNTEKSSNSSSSGSSNEKKSGRSHVPNFSLSPNCGLFLHKNTSSGTKEETPNQSKNDEMTVEDFIHKCPTNKRHEFNNAVATELFPLKHFLFPSKRAFLTYLTEQQKWRWDFYQAYVDLATRVNNTLYKPSSGFAQNCTRFAKMPDHPRGEDVRRCEATSKVLEDIASRIADFRLEVLRRKGVAIYTEAGEARFQPCVSELKFLEQIFEETEKLYEGVITMMSNVNTTWEKLQRLFSEEQVERAERQRVLRRQRENLRKKKKRALISFEKAAVKLLYKISPLLTGQAEHQRSVDELNIMELNMLNTQRDGEMLQFLLDKQYFSGQAVQVILGKIRMLEAICGTDSSGPRVAASVAQ